MAAESNRFRRSPDRDPVALLTLPTVPVQLAGTPAIERGPGRTRPRRPCPRAAAPTTRTRADPEVVTNVRPVDPSASPAARSPAGDPEV